MTVRRFIHKPEELLKQGKEIAKQPADPKFIHCVTMANLVLSGMKVKDLSQCCGDSVRTINLWVKKVDEKGWDSLVTKKPKGRPSVLTDTQLEEIKQAVSNKPEKYGYLVWDGPTLSDYIKTTYSIEYGVRACQKLFHRLGFSLIRPQTYPSLENPDSEARNEFKKLQNMSKNPDFIPVFQDEVHFQAQTSITRTWAPKGSEPKVMSKPGKNKIAYSGFVIPAIGELYVTKPGWFNYESVIQSFRDFIKSNPAPAGKKYCMILDNAPWHKKAIRLVWKEASDEDADIRGVMEYLSLPPVTPPCMW